MRLKSGICTIVFTCIFYTFVTPVYSLAVPQNKESFVVKYQAEADYPPFKYTEDNFMTGFDVELISLLLRNEDYHLDKSIDNWNNVYRRIKDGSIDTCGMLAVSGTRKNDILYSNEVMNTNISVYVNKNLFKDGNENLKLEELSKYKIGVGKGQYSEDTLNEKLGIEPFRSYDTVLDAVYGLASGEIDILFENQEVVNYILITRNLRSRIEARITDLYPVQVAIGVSKNRPALLNYINLRLEAIKKSGEFELLYQKYFYTHSQYYYYNLKVKIISIILLALLILLVIFNTIKLYIKKLKIKLDQEQGFSKKQYEDLIQRENELKGSEERYRLAVEGVNDGIWDWDGRTGKLFMSKRSRTIMGFDVMNENISIEQWFGIIQKDDTARFVRNFSKYIAEPQNKHFQIEYRIKTTDDSLKWIRTRGMAIWDGNGIPVRMAGSNTDITEQKLADEKIHQLAYYDSMTGLPNRTLLLDRFNVAVANAQRKNRMIAVFFLDLDNFKTINDTIGHSFGDMLLLKVGEQLRLRLRKSDTIARLGGDEFIMLQANVKDLSEVHRLAARMLEIFRQPWILDDREFYVTASIGISLFPGDGIDFQTLLKNADAAMYKAKEAGKNNFKIYTHEINMMIMKRLELENSLRKAEERGEFVLWYQPQVDLATGRAVSMEALIRWNNPMTGSTPENFINIAEEIGVINSIGRWVLRYACKQLAVWRSKGVSDLKLSVNLSARQFQGGNLVDTVSEIIEETGVKAEWLELEITETIAMKDLEYTISTLQRLRDMGIGVSLDDFGTGYSSLNYLKLLPIKNLKIDKSFVHDITEDSNQAKIAKALISLAHNLNLTVTAEGVEDLNQLEFLKKEKCDIVQGYLLSKPLPADELDLSTDKNYLPSTNHLSSSSQI